jgi:acyl dehydratase
VHLFAMAVSLSLTGTKDDPVAAVSALGFDKMRLHAPSRPGDELFQRSEVIEARPSKSRPGLGVVRTRDELVNRRDQLIFSYESAFLVSPANDEAGRANRRPASRSW